MTAIVRPLRSCELRPEANKKAASRCYFYCISSQCRRETVTKFRISGDRRSIHCCYATHRYYALVRCPRAERLHLRVERHHRSARHEIHRPMVLRRGSHRHPTADRLDIRHLMEANNAEPMEPNTAGSTVANTAGLAVANTADSMEPRSAGWDTCSN